MTTVKIDLEAAELLGMPRLDFIRHASRLGIPHIAFRLSPAIRDQVLTDAGEQG